MKKLTKKELRKINAGIDGTSGAGSGGAGGGAGGSGTPGGSGLPPTNGGPILVIKNY